jgi:hypothetical protein
MKSSFCYLAKKKGFPDFISVAIFLMSVVANHVVTFPHRFKLIFSTSKKI